MWEAARLRLLVKEKELTRARDAMAAERRRMPWTAVNTAYEFEGPSGPASLLDLFEGRQQLIVYRAFLEPGVHGLARPRVRRLLDGRQPGRPRRPPAPPEHHPGLRLPRPAGRHPAGEGPHGLGDALVHDDGQLRRGLRRRPSWHGTNAFIRDGDQVFRTYFVDNRGDEVMGGTWSYLDMTALGRQEEWEDSPEGYPQDPPSAGGPGTTRHCGPVRTAPASCSSGSSESTGGVTS